ncbi:MAG: adenylosuccinate synthase [Phycisphaerae bacterium]
MDFQNLGHTCVVGLHWGDEGKGKIVDVLTEHFDIVGRYNGGANAGHTVRVDGRRFAFHLMPSGVIRPGVTGVIGPGVVVDPEVLGQEIDELRGRGIAVGENLRVSDRAHVIMPYHKKQDRLSEQALQSGHKIGTTSRGIGPCYADKMQRSTAVRVCDLMTPGSLRPRIEAIVEQRNRIFAAVYGDTEPLDANEVYEGCLRHAERLAPFVCDTTVFYRDAIRAGKRLLFEGANGALLDVDHGTYPFVTSSTTGPAGVAAGSGLPARTVKTCIGVVKAYTTRVGAGPFPTELNNEIGQYIRDRGHEYGTTTGRPRRCGWFDAAAARYSAALTGVDYVAVMHLDTLGGLKEVGICTEYRRQGKRIDGIPASAEAYASVEPQIEMMPGWPAELGPVETFRRLPDAARRYIERLDTLIGTPVAIISIGPERSQTIYRT